MLSPYILVYFVVRYDFTYDSWWSPVNVFHHLSSSTIYLVKSPNTHNGDESDWYNFSCSMSIGLKSSVEEGSQTAQWSADGNHIAAHRFGSQMTGEMECGVCCEDNSNSSDTRGRRRTDAAVRGARAEWKRKEWTESEREENCKNKIFSDINMGICI